MSFASIIPVIMALAVACLYLKWTEHPKSLAVDNINATYDYIIVGAGSSGATLAARLSENPNVTVLVLEAGEDDLGHMCNVPLFNWRTLLTSADWAYYTVPQKHAALSMVNRQIYLPRGKILGGSSQLNTMNIVRGSRHDYDQWAANGCTGWSYNDVLPYFKKSENVMDNKLMESGYRSNTGPMKITNDRPSLITKAFLDAAKELGEKVDDFNAGDIMAFGQTQKNIDGGVRGSSSRVFLRPAMSRPNLHVMVHAHVTKIKFDKMHKAAGATFIHKGQKREVSANKEIILSAGAIGSPQILMLSGIGPKKHLTELNIPVITDLPVGDNLQDHTISGLSMFITKQTTKIWIPQESLWEKFKYELTGASDVYGTPGMATGALAWLKVGDHWKRPQPNIQLYMVPPSPEAKVWVESQGYTEQALNYSLTMPEEVPAGAIGFFIAASLLNPKSSGTLRLKSNDAFDYPLIDPQLLKEKDDVTSLVAAIRFIQKIVKTDAMQEYGVVVNSDPYGPCKKETFNSDQYWKCFVRHLGSGIYHLSSTCKMGAKNDNSAVVDPELKVRGVQGLRVVDASIMPFGISGNTHAPCLMIAEKAADMIKQSWRSS